jgi:N utilization substance protein A
VDEMIAQLLVSEGFASVEEIAYVPTQEIAGIEGFGESTAGEIQQRARDYLEEQEAAHDARRRELGVADDVAEIPGLTSVMLVALGEKGVKTIEDLADCATDDLIGWNEKLDSGSRHNAGVLEAFELTREDAERLILEARVRAGWISAEDLARNTDESAESADESADGSADESDEDYAVAGDEGGQHGAEHEKDRSQS